MLLAALALTPAAAGSPSIAAPAATIVPAASRIDDFEARRTLARLLSYRQESEDEAIGQYEVLLIERPEDPGLKTELATILLRRGRTSEALAMAEKALADRALSDPVRLQAGRLLHDAGRPSRALEVLDPLLETSGRSPELRGLLADVTAALGRAARSRELSVEALERSQPGGPETLAHAARILLWGDYHGAERLCRDYLKVNPRSVDAQLLLARVLAESHRFAEAEGVYRGLLQASPETAGDKGAAGRRLEALTGIARARFLERDMHGAIAHAAEATRARPESPEALQIHADALMALGRHREAAQLYSRMLGQPAGRRAGLLGSGRALMETGETPIAMAFFEKARVELRDEPLAELLATSGDAEARASLLRRVLEDRALGAWDLERWGRALSAVNDPATAVTFLEAAAARDPESFTARMGLVEGLAALSRYGAALEVLEELSSHFPESSKLLLWQARILSWSKRYGESLERYEKLIARSSADPVPRLERARILSWAGRHGRSQDAYAELVSSTENPRVRRAAELEASARDAVWQKRPREALAGYEELTGLEPGNQEARFGAAQLQFWLGLRDEAMESYRGLLQVSADHELAARGLEGLETLSRPAGVLAFSRFDESGRGGLTDLTRTHSAATVEVPFSGRYSAFLSRDWWNEEAPEAGISADARGHTLRVAGQLDRDVAAEASWTRREYDNGAFPGTDTGYLHLRVAPADGVRLGLDYDRADELHNRFGLAKGTQSEGYALALGADLTRRLEVSGQARLLDYNDGNTLRHYSVAAGHTFGEFPRSWKVALTLDRRDTDQAAIFTFAGASLVDIVHPYWTPQDYTSKTLTVGWFHDLTQDRFAGGERVYYDSHLSIGTDSEDNDFARLEASGHRELSGRWSAEVSGLVHRSRLYDADGVRAALLYRF